jgi:hypothetical protein
MATPVERAWRDVPLFARGPNARRSTSQYFSITPGLFSGEMRKVVQLLLGAGLPVKYDWRWDRTHGVYTAAGKWLIEISRARGVLAKNLPRCLDTAKKEPLKSKLGYMPLGGSFPADPAQLDQAIEDGTVRRLLSADAMRPFYAAGRTAFYGGCGWAFSATGRLARNTSLGFRASDGYAEAQQWEITIEDGVDEKNRVRPERALLKQVSAGPLGTDNSDAPALKFPTWDGQLISLRIDRGGAPDFAIDTPFYVYFTGEEPVVFRQYFNPAELSHADDPPLEDQYETDSIDIAFAPYPRYFSDFGTYTSKRQITQHRRGAGVVTPKHQPEDTGSWTEDRVEFVNDGFLYDYANFGSEEQEVVEVNKVDRTLDLSRTTVVTWKEAFIVPPFEREAYYHYTRRIAEYDNGGSRSTWRNQTAMTARRAPVTNEYTFNPTRLHYRVGRFTGDANTIRYIFEGGNGAGDTIGEQLVDNQVFDDLYLGLYLEPDRALIPLTAETVKTDRHVFGRSDPAGAAAPEAREVLLPVRALAQSRDRRDAAHPGGAQRLSAGHLPDLARRQQTRRPRLSVRRQLPVRRRDRPRPSVRRHTLRTRDACPPPASIAAPT